MWGLGSGVGGFYQSAPYHFCGALLGPRDFRSIHAQLWEAGETGATTLERQIEALSTADV